MVPSVLKASSSDLSSLTSEESILSSVLSAIVKPAELSDFDASFPPLTIKKDLDAKSGLIKRIDRTYGAQLKANPNFHRLITPLIKFKEDSNGYHMSFVWSDMRVSCLKLFAETIKPPIFTYDSALEELANPNGPERYKFFMTHVTSFPQPVDLSRTVWANIFNITEAQFRTLSEVIDFLDLYPDLKEVHIKNVFESTFLRFNWDDAYWKRFTASLLPVRRSSASLPTLDVR